MNTDMLRRIATIKINDVENLPRIHIDSDGALFQLMVWRNKNKEKVRDIIPVIKEGVISAISYNNYFYFLQSDNDVYMMKKITDEELVALVIDIETSTVKEIINSISFYPNDEAIQDLITVYATCMAYLNEDGITKMYDGDVYTIDKVLL